LSSWAASADIQPADATQPPPQPESPRYRTSRRHLVSDAQRRPRRRRGRTRRRRSGRRRARATSAGKRTEREKIAPHVTPSPHLRCTEATAPTSRAKETSPQWPPPGAPNERRQASRAHKDRASSSHAASADIQLADATQPPPHPESHRHRASRRHLISDAQRRPCRRRERTRRRRSGRRRARATSVRQASRERKDRASSFEAPALTPRSSET
jgi:hypothetical protein